MDLREQVCLLEQAVLLRELGIEQTSLFYFIKQRQSAFPEPMIYYCGQVVDDKEKFGDSAFGIDVIASAYTSDELELMLNHFSERIRGHYFYYIILTHGLNNASFQPAKHKANALAALLIYLLQNKYILLLHCNQRLLKTWVDVNN